jgi:hypothetical protein
MNISWANSPLAVLAMARSSGPVQGNRIKFVTEF